MWKKGSGEADTPRDAAIEGNSWAARDDELAARVDIHDLPGFFTKRLRVEPGTVALVYNLDDGRAHFQGRVGPGNYTLQGFLETINNLGRKKDITAVLVRDGDFPLSLTLGDLPTAEYLPLEVVLELGFHAADEQRFADRLLAGRRVYTLADLKRLVAPMVRQALVEYIQPRGIRELYADRAGLRKALDEALASHLGRQLADLGVGIDGLRTLAVGHTEFDAHNNARAKAWLDVDTSHAELEKRKQLDELYSEEEMRKIARMETDQQLRALRRDLGRREREAAFADRLDRVGLLERVLQANSREAALKADGADAVDAIEHEARHKGVLREDEVLGWEQTRTLAKVQRDQELALARMDAEKAAAIARATFEHDMKFAALKREIELTRTWEDEEGRRRLAGLEQDIKVAGLQRDEKLKDKRVDEEVHQIDLRKRKAEQEMEIELATRWRDVKKQQALDEQQIQDLEARRKAEHLRTLADIDAQLSGQEGDKEIRLRELDVDRDKAKFQSEADIARAEEARRTLEGEKDARIGDHKDMLERLLQQERERHDTIRGIVQDLAKGQSSQTVIMTPNGPAQTVQGGQVSGDAVVCPGCRTRNPATNRFCTNCGKEIG